MSKVFQRRVKIKPFKTFNHASSNILFYSILKQFKFFSVAFWNLFFQARSHNPEHPGEPSRRISGGTWSRTYKEPVS